MNTLRWKCFFWGLLFISPLLLADNDWARQRVQFQEAKQALEQADLATLAQLKTELLSYPIAYYLAMG